MGYQTGNLGHGRQSGDHQAKSKASHYITQKQVMIFWVTSSWFESNGTFIQCTVGYILQINFMCPSFLIRLTSLLLNYFQIVDLTPWDTLRNKLVLNTIRGVLQSESTDYFEAQENAKNTDVMFYFPFRMKHKDWSHCLVFETVQIKSEYYMILRYRSNSYLTFQIVDWYKLIVVQQQHFRNSISLWCETLAMSSSKLGARIAEGRPRSKSHKVCDTRVLKSGMEKKAEYQKLSHEHGEYGKGIR